MGVALLVVCGLLLLSMGGAVIAAPVTLPLLYLVVRRHPTPAFRWTGGVIAALTAAEVAWALLYVAAGEVKPAIWLVPAFTAAAVLVLFVALLERPALG